MASKPLHMFALLAVAAVLTFSIFLIMAVLMGPSADEGGTVVPESPFADATPDGECEQLRLETILVITAQGSKCTEAAAGCFDLTFDDGPMNCTVRIGTSGLQEVRQKVAEYARECPWVQPWCEPGERLEFSISAQ